MNQVRSKRVRPAEHREVAAQVRVHALDQQVALVGEAVAPALVAALPEAVAGEVAAPQQVAVDHDAALAGRIQHHVVAMAAVEGMDVKVDLDRFGVEQACRDATGVGQLHAGSPWCARPSAGWRITPVSPGQSHDGNLS
ncbi:MAG: hypothetical protein C0451_04845 [Comamonadaceae bacterium]|nr:hypothetical protein [Comamonadaceae bacterium]